MATDDDALLYTINIIYPQLAFRYLTDKTIVYHTIYHVQTS